MTPQEQQKILSVLRDTRAFLDTFSGKKTDALKRRLDAACQAISNETSRALGVK